jgi:hypothetical protein
MRDKLSRAVSWRCNGTEFSWQLSRAEFSAVLRVEEELEVDL